MRQSHGELIDNDIHPFNNVNAECPLKNRASTTIHKKHNATAISYASVFQFIMSGGLLNLRSETHFNKL